MASGFDLFFREMNFQVHDPLFYNTLITGRSYADSLPSPVCLPMSSQC
jgi:hypothetical protein